MFTELWSIHISGQKITQSSLRFWGLSSVSYALTCQVLINKSTSVSLDIPLGLMGKNYIDHSIAMADALITFRHVTFGILMQNSEL